MDITNLAFPSPPDASTLAASCWDTDAGAPVDSASDIFIVAMSETYRVFLAALSRQDRNAHARGTGSDVLAPVTPRLGRDAGGSLCGLVRRLVVWLLVVVVMV